ncbi:VOC family protein [Spongisporangium articulatum]|uniref:VOC family protein n=1 Tax=Spongisporangium articulatum TaxID=3362603 RepID=A0ABW8AMA2_9ACTN
MDIQLSHCFVTVHDPDLAIAFYRDVLGLEVTADASNGGHRWVTVQSPTQAGVQIVLTEPHGGRSQADGDALMELLTKGSLNAVAFATDDLDGLFEKVQAAGTEVLQEPMEQFWGQRDCAFRDPSGNMIRINEKR